MRRKTGEVKMVGERISRTKKKRRGGRDKMKLNKQERQKS